MMESIKKLREMTGAGMMDVKKALSDAAGNEEKAVALLRERGIVKAAKKGDREAKEGLVAFVISENKKTAAIVEVNCETDFVARNSDFQALVSDFAQALLSNRSSSLEGFKESAMKGSTVALELAAAAGKIGENLLLSRVQYLETTGSIGGYVHSNGKIGVLVELSGEGDQAQAVTKDIAMHVAAERPRYLDRSEVNTADLEAEKEILTNKAINEGKPMQIVEKIVSGQLSKFYEDNVLLEQRFVKDNAVKIADILPQGMSLKCFVRFEIGT